MALPIRTRPTFPLSQSLPSANFHSDSTYKEIEAYRIILHNDESTMCRHKIHTQVCLKLKSNPKHCISNFYSILIRLYSL